MSRAFRIIKLVFLVLGLLLLLAIPVTGLISAAVHYEGVCERQAGEPSPCSWWQYAVNEMFWVMFIFIPYFFAAAVAWTGMSLVQFIQTMVRKYRSRGAEEQESR
jgi:phosphotransferase system  glucose/maltose/N-acetylglucosamine-specific IIC component